jgi:lysophospholipase L1-like esterase
MSSNLPTDAEPVRKPPRVGWRRKLVAVLLASLVSLLLGEGVLRLVGVKPLYVNPEQRLFWHYHARLGWHHRPGQSGRFAKKQFDTSVTINSRGLRDREYPLDRVEGKQRILVLGDSFTWGFGVEQEEIFTEVAETQFQHVEVINAGVSAYSPDQELLWLQDEGIRYRPDLVLLVLSGNDVWGNHQQVISFVYGKPRYRLDVDGVLQLENVPVPKPRASVSLRHWLRQRSSIAQLLISALERVRYRMTARNEKPVTESLGKADRQPFPLTLALIREIEQVAAAGGARLAIVTNNIYWTRWPDGDYSDFVGQLRAAGYPVLDIDSLPEYEKSQLQIPGDRHWNVEGHQLIGRAIQEWISEKKLLTTNP